MKLGSLKKGRDGELCVIDRLLKKAVKVSHIAPTLQAAIENWREVESSLQEIYDALNNGEVAHPFDYQAKQMASPLPRAYQWADGSAYVNHVELVRKARDAEMPADFWEIPLMYQGGSDYFLNPTAPIEIADESFGIDFEAEIAIITDDVPMGVSEEEAVNHIRLIMLVNDVSLRNLIPAEIGRGFGFFQSKPSSSFSPVALTPAELGEAWDGKCVSLPLMTYLNNKLFGQPNAGTDMTFSFPQLIAHAARTRQLSAGTIIGSGTVSNYDRSNGSSCLVEKRMLETIANGSPTTEYLKFGDTIRIEMLDDSGANLFGTIEQTVIPYKKKSLTDLNITA